MNLDPDACYRAFLTKDARFDGKLFVGVRTTGIFCRPICPARTPKRENCTFFTSAAAVHEAGFRPCLRCRPELAPHLFAQIGKASTVSRALRLIAEGTLDDGTVGELAAQLGMSDRHLRQLFAKHLGTSPAAVAQTRRLLFAKQLIDETSLSMTDIAMAAGFSSIRRFNAAIRKTYQRSPSELRRQQIQQGDAVNTPEIVLKLPFSPPYNWSALVRFLAARVTPGLESVGADFYRRTISLDGVHGIVEVSPVKEQHYLVATIRFPKIALLAQIVERLRRVFDLDANVADIMSHLQQNSVLSPAIAALPGLRVPGVWDSFELAVRAILGQQISVAAATTLAGRLVEAYGERLVIEGMSPKESELRFVFPRPEVLADADLTALGITRPRALAIASLAAVVVRDRHILTNFQNLDDAVQKLSKFPGIGEWTAQYIAMRALREPDAFPATDLGLLRAMENLGHPVTRSELLKLSQAWRPWRAYAAMFLWSSLDSTPILIKEKLLA